jgi:hypothetical protein
VVGWFIVENIEISIPMKEGSAAKVEKKDKSALEELLERLLKEKTSELEYRVVMMENNVLQLRKDFSEVKAKQEVIDRESEELFKESFKKLNEFTDKLNLISSEISSIEGRVSSEDERVSLLKEQERKSIKELKKMERKVIRYLRKHFESKKAREKLVRAVTFKAGRKLRKTKFPVIAKAAEKKVLKNVKRKVKVIARKKMGLSVKKPRKVRR